MYNTNHKNELISFFTNNKNDSFTAKELVNIYKDEIDKATIYRNLKVLEQTNVIFKTYNDITNSYEYTLNCNCKNHIHLKCTSCGKLEHLKCSEVNTLFCHIEQKHMFKIESFAQTIYGKCEKCRI